MSHYSIIRASFRLTLLCIKQYLVESDIPCSAQADCHSIDPHRAHRDIRPLLPYKDEAHAHVHAIA